MNQFPITEKTDSLVSLFQNGEHRQQGRDSNFKVFFRNNSSANMEVLFYLVLKLMFNLAVMNGRLA